MEEEKKESVDPMDQIPEAMRGMFKKMLDDQISKQVEAQVQERMAKMNEEMTKLKQELDDAKKKQAEAPKTPAPKKTFGMSRPSAVTSSSAATPKRPVTSRLDRNEPTPTTTPRKPTQMSSTANSGLKRPTTAAATRPTPGTTSRLGAARQSVQDPMNKSTMSSTSANSSTITPARTRPGLKKPSDVQKPDIASKLKDKLQNGVKETMTKATPKRTSVAPAGPKSAETDELDSIYNEEDPIDSSIGIRKKAGNITQTVADKNSKHGKFFFTLRTAGEPVKISEEAIKAVAIAEGRTDASGKVIEEEKPKVDPIDKQLQLRLKGGSITNVVVNKDKKTEEIAFKLKIKGGQPKLAEARKDPNEALANAAAEKEAEVLKLQKTPCIIDISIGERIKAGSQMSTVASKDKDNTVVFKLRQKGDMPELAEPRVDPAAMLMNAEGKLVSPEKKSKGKPCEIDLSLQERVAAGSLTTTVPEAKKEEQPEVFALKQQGEILVAKKEEEISVPQKQEEKPVPQQEEEISVPQQEEEISVVQKVEADQEQVVQEQADQEEADQE